MIYEEILSDLGSRVNVNARQGVNVFTHYSRNQRGRSFQSELRSMIKATCLR
jgi:hypothetical protein